MHRPPSPIPKRRSFAAFAIRDFKIYWIGASAAFMADNIEHVVSYWMMWQKFHSPALQAFAVVSHWVPYLLLAAFTGGLADRFDIRRLIQIAMFMFMGVSIGWGVMFASNSLEQWKAMALLVVHGLAGALWLPASQVLIHKIVDAEQLASAVRLNATGRYLAFFVGPGLGGIFLLFFGPIYGIFINALIYGPLFLWLIDAPYGPERASAQRPPGIRGFADVISAMQVVARSPVLLSVTVLVGASAFFVGNAYQAQMPGFAADLGHADAASRSYGALLGADALGGLIGGLILESRGLLLPRVRTAYILAMVWCVALAGFARTHSYLFALMLLFVAGFVELAFNSMAQSLVQLNAPAEIRGRVIGVFAMSASGLRTFSGFTVGLLGAAIGIHDSLSYNATALLLVLSAIFALYHVAGRRRASPS